MPALLALLTVLSVPPQLPADACALLKRADLSAFGTAGAPRNADMVVDSGPASGQTVKGCMWKVGSDGMIAISVARLPTGAAHQAGLAMLEQTYNRLKAQGWSEEKQDITGGRCALLTPPAAEKDAPITTGCMAEAKGLAVSVSALGKTRVTIEQVKALLDLLVQRLR